MEASSPGKRWKQLEHNCGGCMRVVLRQRSRMVHHGIGENQEVMLSAGASVMHRQGLRAVMLRWTILG